jgi:hypothetical protein
MHWLDRGPLHELFWSWPDPEQQLRSLELQARLCEILRQYARPVTPATSETSKKQEDKPSSEPPVAQHTHDASQQGSAQEQVLPTESKQEEAKGQTPSDEIQYEKIPRNERPSDLIVSASDPEVRTGHKTAHKSFLGDKYQVVETADQRIIVDMEPIPGNEHDGERVVEMIDRLTELHQFKPGELVGDTAYGTGSNRLAMESRDIALTAPVRNPISNGFFDNSQFQYDAQNQTMTCPNNQTTSRRVRNNVEEGHQFIFDTKMCQACPLLSKCTKAKKRTVFVSDYYEHIQRAMKHNETEAGKQALQARREIERMNNEIKNHIGMKESKEHSREKRRIQAKLTAMVINIRTMVKKLLPPAEPIQRYKRRAASPCA